MKTEGQFNAHLGKEFRRYYPKLKCLKVADKFSVGISDFLLWGNGRSVGIEAKFIDALPTRDSTKILTHPFAGAQITFMEDLKLAGSKAYGLIAIDSHKVMYLFDPAKIPNGGNFTKEEFLSKRHAAMEFGFDQVPELVEYLFGSLQ